MTDELETAPLPDPVPKPETIAEPAPAAEVTPVAVIAPVEPAVPAPAATPAQASASVNKRNQVLGIGAQAAGIVGIFLFVALALVVILGRGWATSTVDDLAGGIAKPAAAGVRGSGSGVGLMRARYAGSRPRASPVAGREPRG